MNATTGTWVGLTVDGKTKHRGPHAAVLDADGEVIAITGPMNQRKHRANARLLADLINKAAQQNVHPTALN